MNREGIAQSGHAVPQAEGHVIGVAGHVKVQAILQQRLELDAQQAALGQHGAPLLHVPAEVVVRGVHHQGLTEEGAVLGAADVEGIRQCRQVREGQVIVRRGEGGTQPGTVQEQEQAVSVAASSQSGQLGLGVNGADLRGVGDIHHFGGDHVLRAVVFCQDRLHQGGGQLAVGRIDGADLVAGGLNSAGLMGIDVGGMGADDRLIGLQ